MGSFKYVLVLDLSYAWHLTGFRSEGLQVAASRLCLCYSATTLGTKETRQFFGSTNGLPLLPIELGKMSSEQKVGTSTTGPCS
jgi:hypothetical protein